MMVTDEPKMDVDEVPMAVDGIEDISTETLAQYYQRLFPFSVFYQWLNYKAPAPTSLFTHREFSFTINDGIYLRYQSFKDGDELHREVQRLAPSKIDIGAVFTAQPRNAKSLQPGAFRPVAKELVFDVDMTDYDDVRTCCQGGSICKLCWRFMIVAMHVVDRALREDFGFEKLMWVYSGRRGVHCWVCDERARALDDAGRKAVAKYLSMVRGGAEQNRKVNLSQRQAAHPHVTRSMNIIEEYFEDILLVDQEILLTQERWTKILAALPDEELRKSLDAQWSKHPDRSSVEKWSEMIDAVDRRASKRGAKFGLASFERDMMLQLTYPRLDENVTTHLNHLLKSPFCVHPKTGRVCTPIASDCFDSFDPFQAPTLGQLLRELNSGSSDSTSLAEYVNTFSSFVDTLLPVQDAKPSQVPSLEF
ncbi:p48 polypeptide of DNA primase [Coemansia sp. RSA 1822]|nr:p48 polypeptide of DNA primase [Coemansia sp. RSA 638]KAJ2543615.1 p48 polypeptide of DNA primase [Coemansia sp. RSA 1853]KAJ2565006.1 p48 polypeptide of DNA primase [Coemansia sp. RSA 1822]